MARRVPRSFEVPRGASSDAALPEYMRGIDADAPPPPKPVEPEPPKKPNLLAGLANKSMKQKLVASMLSDAAEHQTFSKKREQGRLADSSASAPGATKIGKLSARLVLCTSLGAPYEDDPNRYKDIVVPDSHILVLDGLDEIIIPDGEIQLHLSGKGASGSKEALRSYHLAYGPLLPHRSQPFASHDGSMVVVIKPLDDDNFALESITLRVPHSFTVPAETMTVTRRTSSLLSREASARRSPSSSRSTLRWTPLPQPAPPRRLVRRRRARSCSRPSAPSCRISTRRRRSGVPRRRRATARWTPTVSSW